MTKQLLALTIALALTIGPAILHGRFSNRWETPANLDEAGVRLHELPRQIGSWRNQEDQRQLSVGVRRELGLVGHFHRRYFHANSGQRLDVLLMVGPPGRLVRHPPEVCYANLANERVGDLETLELIGQADAHSFRLLNFRRVVQPAGGEFSVAYAFATHNANWQTPNSPRMAFGAQPLLYKVQVLSDRSAVAARQDIEDFLGGFVDAFSTTTVGESPEQLTATTEEVR
ncbi:MAG: hypothetical protein AAGD11_16460 [Planctomycetota bacterium]